ncbi:MAG: peptidoglycan DD-metalloendopeptidase family protein [Betaproteobacteria bacterium]|nr:peptidoglycan DD-metalloendopeptidase family protein [Betaproteobacteria bacterium]
MFAGGCAWNEQPIHSPGGAPSASRPSGKPMAASRVSRRKGDERPEYYVVQRGDTLFGIALDFGFDYRDIANWNDLQDPSRILVGQRLRLQPPAPKAVLPPAGTEIKPVAIRSTIESEPLPPAPAASDAHATKTVDGKVPVFSAPKALALPYSEQALAQLKGTQATSAPATAAEPPRKSTPPPSEPDAKASVDKEPVDDEAVEWVWPVRGELLYRFGDAGRLKGIGIGGKAGQPVAAAANGKVVYSGSGLRGYGNLVIVKHNETYLSVYAHNQSVMVKEGDMVKRNQKIAEMGDTGAARVGLHFEVRRFGKPVDPLGTLPQALDPRP